MLSEEIMRQLRPVTPEEQKILDGKKEIDRDIYMDKETGDVIHSRKLLDNGKQIDVRLHTRFAAFPPHTHDYVELVYMCSGSTVNYVNGERIPLEQGDILLIGKGATHAADAAGMDDIAVNIIIVPEFLSSTMRMIGTDNTPIHEFMLDFLQDEQNSSPYLYFQVADIKPIQNCVENLIYSLLGSASNKRKVNRTTLALLFLNLISNSDRLVNKNSDNSAMIYTLRYIENHYVDGTLNELAEQLNYDASWLSREIKSWSGGKTFVELIQQRRLAQAVFYLENTDMKIDDIGHTIGYENLSYFYRLFKNTYGESPRVYRKNRRPQK